MVLLPTPRSLSYNWLAQGGPANIIYTYEGRIKSRNVWICVSTWIVMCLQAMSKQWKEDWNKDECPPVPRIFWFYFFISNLRDLQTLLGLGFEFPHEESAALQFTDTGCTETHWWSYTYIKLCRSVVLVSVDFRQKWTFPQYICAVHQHRFANFIFPHRIAGGLWDWTFWSVAKPKQNHHNWI